MKRHLINVMAASLLAGCSHPSLPPLSNSSPDLPFSESPQGKSEADDPSKFSDNADIAHSAPATEETNFWTSALDAKVYRYYINPAIAANYSILLRAGSQSTNGKSSIEPAGPPNPQRAPILVTLALIPDDDKELAKAKFVRVILTSDCGGSRSSLKTTAANPWNLQGGGSTSTESGVLKTGENVLTLFKASKYPAGPGNAPSTKPTTSFQITLEPHHPGQGD